MQEAGWGRITSNIIHITTNILTIVRNWIRYLHIAAKSWMKVKGI
jgi:hypothetical protein